MTIRIAAIEVSHWHAVYDAAYLRHLIAMPDVELVAVQDSDADVAAKRAAEVKNPSIFTDYRKMLAGHLLSPLADPKFSRSSTTRLMSDPTSSAWKPSSAHICSMVVFSANTSPYTRRRPFSFA